jgi:hypothetical protein
MALSTNQFGILNTKGALTLAQNFNIVDCIVYASESGTLVPGQAVKLVDVAASAIIVQAIAANTDAVFGFVCDNFKVNEFTAGQAIKIAIKDCVMLMEAGAAIARGATLMPVVTGQKVVTQTSGKTAIGITFDKAAASGDLVRVYITTPNLVLAS